MYEMQRQSFEDQDIMTGLEKIYSNIGEPDRDDKNYVRWIILIKEGERLITTGRKRGNTIFPGERIREKDFDSVNNFEELREITRHMGMDIIRTNIVTYGEKDKERFNIKEDFSLEVKRKGREKVPMLSLGVDFTISNELTNLVTEIAQERRAESIAMLTTMLDHEGTFVFPESKAGVDKFEEGLVYGYPNTCVQNFHENKKAADFRSEKDLSEYELFLLENIVGWKYFTEEGFKNTLEQADKIYNILKEYERYSILFSNEWMEREEGGYFI